MNPWAVLLLGVALVLIIISVKNTQENVLSAITGKARPNSVFAPGQSNAANASVA